MWASFIDLLLSIHVNQLTRAHFSIVKLKCTRISLFFHLPYFYSQLLFNFSKRFNWQRMLMCYIVTVKIKENPQYKAMAIDHSVMLNLYRSSLSLLFWEEESSTGLLHWFAIVQSHLFNNIFRLSLLFWIAVLANWLHRTTVTRVENFTLSWYLRPCYE